jgi:tripartite-type tricarboxylate transporter receptor subunit TctC
MNTLRALLVAAAGLASTAAAAQDNWPDRPIRLLVPVAAGGGIDLMARLLAEGLSRQLPQRVTADRSIW